MRAAGLAAVFLAAMVAAVALFSVFPRSSPTADTVSAGLPTRTPIAATPVPTPVPHSWVEALITSRNGVAIQLACLDTGGDGRINGDDDPELSGVDIPLADATGCDDPDHHRDFYAGDPSDAAGYRCGAAQPPVLIVAVGSALSDLYDTSVGESLGILDIVREVQARTEAAGITTVPILADSAIASADLPQTRMEQWLAHEVQARMDALPCLRAVLIGHSHGGVAVTSLTAKFDDRYAGRMFGVLIDRTIALYDHDAEEMPATTPLLNLFQLNEGWHGSPIDLPNVTNVDASRERAPIAPSDGGGGGLALVSHKTLDDAPAVQQRVVDAVLSWIETSSNDASMP